MQKLDFAVIMVITMIRQYIITKTILKHCYKHLLVVVPI